MKVAVCISGLMRTYQTCYQSLIDNVLLPNNADLFISTWPILGTSTYKMPGQPWILIPGEEAKLNQDDARQVYGKHLKVFHVEEWEPLQKRFKEELEESCKNKPSHVCHDPRNVAITRRLVSMWYKIRDVNRLRKEYEEKNGFKYDVIVRGRPDIRHKMVLKMSDYDIKENNIFTDLKHNYNYVCDQFAFGKPDTMDKYCSVYPSILHYNNEIACYIAEAMLLYHLKHKVGVDYKHVELDYKLVNCHGER